MNRINAIVVICFHFSIFEPLETADSEGNVHPDGVVICFHFSIFEPLETAFQHITSKSNSCDLLSF